MTENSSRIFRFQPSLGAWRLELTRYIRCLRRDGKHAALEEMRDAVERNVQRIGLGEEIPADELRLSFALSLLLDILDIGGDIEIHDSEIQVIWPRWNTSRARRGVREALEEVTRVSPPSQVERENLTDVFLTDTSAAGLRSLATEGRFSLVDVKSDEANSVLRKAFSTALRGWTMPYRGREGRMKRFVLLAESPQLENPVVVGLLEIGDEAPYSTERDRFLSLTPDGLAGWLLSSDTKRKAAALEKRYKKMRYALRNIDRVDPLGECSDILRRREELEEFASGRSKSSDNYVEKKRIAYLLRIAAGEHSMRTVIATGEINAESRHFRAGVRAIHDLTVPRVHMEVTVCGAVPPFSRVLGGKLVTSFLAHPAILRLASGPPGDLVCEIFKQSDIASLLPRYGLLAITTKGLYPEHSALYNRAIMPGAQSSIRLQKLGLTKGSTTAFLSDQTARLATTLIESADGPRVSRVYGTGGAKRQRFLEAAVARLGLPSGLVHAGVTRPVYGVSYVRNLPEVVWLNRAPDWKVDKDSSAETYSARAICLWRERWADQISRRLEQLSQEDADEDIFDAIRKLSGDRVTTQ